MHRICSCTGTYTHSRRWVTAHSVVGCEISLCLQETPTQESVWMYRQITTPSTQWQQSPSTLKYTWHCAPTSSVRSCRSPTEQRREDGSWNNGPVLIHIRWLSVTCGVLPKAKGHRGSAALYNVTLGRANSQAISLAACKLALRQWGSRAG